MSTATVVSSEAMEIQKLGVRGVEPLAVVWRLRTSLGETIHHVILLEIVGR